MNVKVGEFDMAQFKVYQENYSDVTVVSNIFIDEYMKEANDAQLKVYLYLLRTMSAHLPTSVSDIADQFNHTEKDVLRALKYWEKNRLLALEYDDAKVLTESVCLTLQRKPPMRLLLLHRSYRFLPHAKKHSALHRLKLRQKHRLPILMRNRLIPLTRSGNSRKRKIPPSFCSW